MNKIQTANEINRLELLVKQHSDAKYAAQAEAVQAKEEIKEVRKQFADLKERLSNAEMENQRMRGYIQRVQEDDVVREELVTTGDPEGERMMVPKRKPTMFMQPQHYSELGDHGIMSGYSNRDRPKPKHWVTY